MSTKSRFAWVLTLGLVSSLAGCGPRAQTPDDFKSGLEEAGKAAERGKMIQKGQGGVPPVPDPKAEG